MGTGGPVGLKGRGEQSEHTSSGGWLDPVNRNSDWADAPLNPGRMYPLGFGMQPQDSVVPAARARHRSESSRSCFSQA